MPITRSKTEQLKKALIKFIQELNHDQRVPKMENKIWNEPVNKIREILKIDSFPRDGPNQNMNIPFYCYLFYDFILLVISFIRIMVIFLVFTLYFLF